MCEICYHSPCLSGCPNAPDPPAAFRCHGCEEAIYPEDEYARIDGVEYCEDCIDNMPYSDMANVVTNLVKASPEMFPVDQAISFSTNLTKLMKAAGRNDSEIASIMEGMNKSFQKGAVDTETLNKMLEQAPETANYLAERMGVARTQLLQMATDGTLSVNDLRDAFVASSKEIDAAFGQLNFGVSDALLNIRNKWGFWLKETDEMLGLTQTIGKVMVRGFDMAMGALNRVRNAVVWLTDKLGGTEKAMRLLGIVVGTVFGLKALGGIASFIKGFKDLDKAALGAKAKMLAIVAVIVLIALLVEDFINFMQGNDSVIGSLLEKAGIDTQKVRDTIISAWNRIKDFLGAAWNAIKDTAKSVWDGLKAFWDEHGEARTATIPESYGRGGATGASAGTANTSAGSSGSGSGSSGGGGSGSGSGSGGSNQNGNRKGSILYGAASSMGLL